MRSRPFIIQETQINDESGNWNPNDAGWAEVTDQILEDTGVTGDTKDALSDFLSLADPMHFGSYEAVLEAAREIISDLAETEMPKNQKGEPTFYSDAMTWLNGRGIKIVIIHNGKRLALWKNDEHGAGGVTIEQAIHDFCERHKIDILAEIGK